MNDTPKPLGWYIKTPTDAELAAHPFGGCNCRQGRAECNCGFMRAIKPIPQDLPYNRWTLLIAVIAVAAAAFLSHIWR